MAPLPDSMRTTMKRHTLIALGTAFLGLPVLAAGVSFSGAWVRDAAKSDRPPDTMYWLTRPNEAGGGGGRGRGGNQPPMTIQQDANNLQITDPQGSVHKYALDGKPHANTTPTGVQKATVTASLQGDTLVIGTTQPYGGMPGNITLDIKEVWALSPDGKVLTITTTRSSAATQTTTKQVYNRK
jgi:hypothetical protein